MGSTECERVVRGGFYYMTSSSSENDSESEDDDDPEIIYGSFQLDPFPFRSKAVPSFALLNRTTQLIFENESGRLITRLREPRQLYGISSHLSQILPRWPQECEVLPDEIRHIEWSPAVPEPLGKHIVPEPRAVMPEMEEETLVYSLKGGAAGQEYFFSKSCIAGRGAPLTDIAVELTGPEDTTLQFESRFESGNLFKANRVGDYDYELTLKTDLYTGRHTQWFYFRVRNTRAGVRYRFTIVNLLKASSLYRQGQLPLLYSEALAQTAEVGWHRVGEEVSYYGNGQHHMGQPCFSLTWTMSFPYDWDTCYLAQCYPYTYTHLQTYLAGITSDPVRSSYCTIRVLCHTLAGNPVPILTITNPSQGAVPPKPAVVLTARVHPGETNSSWVMKGLLDYLLGDSEDAFLLRNTFVFKVVPMINPDGVIVGNYRCSLSGRDLNRCYRSKCRESFPSVWAIRNLIQRLCEEREVLLYCDLHGHGCKYNAFTYSCEGPLWEDGMPHERVLPLMLSKNCPDMFSFQNCKFKIHPKKQGTGRVVLWKLGIMNSLTLETSFCGSSLGKRKGTHFSIHDLEMLGFHLCDTLLDYCDPDKFKYNVCLKELQDVAKQEEIRPFTNVFHGSQIARDGSSSGSNTSDNEYPQVQTAEYTSEKVVQRKCKKERDKSKLTKIQERSAKETKDEISKEKKYQLKSLRVTFDEPKQELVKEKQFSDPGTTATKLESLDLLMDNYINSWKQLELDCPASGLLWGQPTSCLHFSANCSSRPSLPSIKTLNPLDSTGTLSHPTSFSMNNSTIKKHRPVRLQPLRPPRSRNTT